MAKINENCPCKRKGCANHGNCEACRIRHADGKTTCQRLAEKEKD